MIAGSVCFLITDSTYGEEVRDGFDGPTTKWQARTNKKTQVDILEHDLSNYIFIRGKASERFEVSNRNALPEQVDFILELPHARVIPDLEISVWFRSNRQTAESWLRVTLPYQADPREPGKLLRFYVEGEPYRKQPGNWQQFTCKTDEKTMNNRLQRLRNELNYPFLDTRGMYVDQLYFSSRIPNGASEFFFDELKMAPVVLASEENAIESASLNGTPPESEAWNLPADFRLDRLSVQGQPFFPIMIPSHDESAASLGLTGVNTVWVKDYRDYQYLQELRRENLWATATPPYLPPPDGSSQHAFQASPAPFQRETLPILFWMLGARVPASEHPMLIDWLQQVRQADQKAARQVMVDTIGDERKISRHFPMISSSRHIVHTSTPFNGLRELITQKHKLARPGMFTSTWIQTEPASRFLNSPLSSQYSLVVEPEQIRLQVFCALQAGCDSIGYWTTTPLASEYPGSLERRLAITDVNLELGLVAPWLAKGDLQSEILHFEPVKAERETLQSRLESIRNWKTAEEVRREKKPYEPVIEGRLIKSEEYGSLLLAVCYNQYSQYVPGALTAENVSVIVPPVPETATAWEITPTGLRALDREIVAGGTKIILDRIDQTAMILFTSNRSQVDELEKKIAEVARQSAQISFDLASAKLSRVQGTIKELQAQGVSSAQRVPSMERAGYLLSEAANILTNAEQMFQQGAFAESRRESQNALRLVRALQFGIWYETVFPRLSSPVSSPYTIAFSSLPSHWEMIKQMGRSDFDTNENLLPLGNFETDQTIALVNSGWENLQGNVEGIRSGALLTDAAQEGKYALRLAAVPTVSEDGDVPAYLERAPIRFNTPRIPVKQGQLLYVSGYVRIARPIQRSDDGFMIYDSLGGQVRALRWFDHQDWQRFSMIRVADTDADFQLSMELTGMGEVHVDDLRVIPINPQSPSLGLEQVNERTQQSEEPNPLSHPLRYLNDLPKKLKNPFWKREEGVE